MSDPGVYSWTLILVRHALLRAKALADAAVVRLRQLQRQLAGIH